MQNNEEEQANIREGSVLQFAAFIQYIKISLGSFMEAIRKKAPRFIVALLS